MADTHEDLPDDSEAAFIILEREYRFDCDQRLGDENDHADRSEIYSQYVGRVATAIDELGISDAPFVIPDRHDEIEYSQYISFRHGIDNLITRIRIRNSKARSQRYVKLDSNAKSKLRSLLEKIKETICELDVSDPKREALLKKVSVLEEEINRDLTRWDILGDLWISLCERTGAGFDKLEPARKWIDSVAGLIAEAKSAEPSIPPLPKSEAPKQLGPPPSSRRNPIDDDIPF